MLRVGVMDGRQFKATPAPSCPFHHPPSFLYTPTTIYYTVPSLFTIFHIAAKNASSVQLTKKNKTYNSDVVLVEF